jgi:dihydroorotase
MSGQTTLILKGGHVIDPAQGIDRITDITIRDGKIAAVGEAPPDPGATVIDLAGKYVSPGWIDIHVHVYGALGFADPDAIGICQGVTSYVEAGGPGIDSLDQFSAMLDGTTKTRLYAGPLFHAMGLVGLNFEEGDPRTIRDIPIARWFDFMKAHPGMLRYLKFSAHGYGSVGPLRMSKGLAETLGLPLYMHVGEFQHTKPKSPLAFAAYDIAGAGDIITHVYHNNLGHILDDQGRVLQSVRDAVRRGVLFDVGFGGFNFSWDIAEKGFSQGLVPDIISSDLQQFNVTGPVFSLAHVMGATMRLGLTLQDTIARVTSAPAKALSLTDCAGSLTPGMPADISVFEVESGAFTMADTSQKTRVAERQIVPVMAFRDGVRFDSDFSRCLDEGNWFMQIVEDRVPAGVDNFSPAQFDFLASLRKTLEGIEWTLISNQLDLDKAFELQNAFHRVCAAHRLPLADALKATYGCFLERAFMTQIGLVLIRLERPLALSRLADVEQRRKLAA